MKSTKKPNHTFPELDVVNLKSSLRDILKSNQLDENPRKNAISKVREAYDNARLSLKSIIFKHPELSQKTLSAYTKITDDVIELATEIGKAEFIRNNHVDPPIVTILAVGGYGRAEMAPFSDIDLLFLLTDKDPSSDKQ